MLLLCSGGALLLNASAAARRPMCACSLLHGHGTSRPGSWRRRRTTHRGVRLDRYGLRYVLDAPVTTTGCQISSDISTTARKTGIVRVIPAGTHPTTLGSPSAALAELALAHLCKL